MDDAALIKWIGQSMKGENVEVLEVDLTGNSGKTDGYLGEISFAKVTCRDKTNGEKEELDLVIKCGQTRGRVELQFITFIFRQEIDVYTKVFPSLLQFQADKNIEAPFANYPKCHNTIMGKDFGAIILDNLKIAGYEIHDRKVPLDIHHVKLLLEVYAKFHATSLALDAQRREEFNKLSSGLAPFARNRFKMVDLFPKTVNVFFDSLLQLLKDRKRPDLHRQLDSFLEGDWNKTLLEMLEENTGVRIISHCDAWNNNYLFKYDEHNNNTPTDVKIIDWQMVDTLNSPVYDLSHFLYNCATVDDLDNLEHLLRHYHDCLSHHLSALGSDPEELFPFSLLKEQWGRYNLFGFIHVPYVIKQCYWSEEDVPSDLFAVNWSEWSDGIVVKDERYFERLFGIVEHFFNYKL